MEEKDGGKEGCSEAPLPLPTSPHRDMPEAHLAGGGGCGARQHRCVGDLDVQVVIVYERPSPLHLAGLESVCESPEVGVPEEPAVGVVGSGRVFVKALLVVADFGAVGALLAIPGGQCPEAGLGRGTILGAVVLHHEIVYAMHGGVVGQVAPAGAGSAAGAVRVGTQCRAKFRRLLRAQVVGARCGRPELRVALENLAWRRHCRRGGKHKMVNACVPACGTSNATPRKRLVSSSRSPNS